MMSSVPFVDEHEGERKEGRHAYMTTGATIKTFDKSSSRMCRVRQETMHETIEDQRRHTIPNSSVEPQNKPNLEFADCFGTKARRARSSAIVSSLEA